jgi:hypothetical protein
MRRDNMTKPLIKKPYDPIPAEVSHDILMLITFYSGIHVGAKLYSLGGGGYEFMKDFFYGPETTDADGNTSRSGGWLDKDTDSGLASRVSIDEILTATSPLYVGTKYGADPEKLLMLFSPAYAAYKATRK